MNKIMLLAAALSIFSLVGCAAPHAEDAASSEDALASDGSGIRVDASWQRVITGTPTIGFDATTPHVNIRVTVNDASVRREHAGFDGYEHVVAYVPKADGSSQRTDLRFRYTTQEGFIQLHPIDVHEAEGFFVTEADLVVIRRDGITVSLETNVGVIGGDSVPVVAKNP